MLAHGWVACLLSINLLVTVDSRLTAADADRCYAAVAMPGLVSRAARHHAVLGLM